jgi:hypothetical protein
MNEKINYLLKLIQENPDREIVPMVDTEVVGGDDHCLWAGSWGNAELCEYWEGNERIYFKDNDFDDLVEKVLDTDNNYENGWENLTNDARDKKAVTIVKNYPWIKCIRVRIDAPK